MINKLSVQFSVFELCDCLNVSRSGYYVHQKRSKYPAKRETSNRKLSLRINSLYLEHRRRYGSPKITQSLRKLGETVNHKRVERLMRLQGLYARKKKRFKPATTDSNHKNPIAPNLLPQHKEKLSGINQVWVSDITYIPTRQGFLYLSAIMDLYSRKLIGYKCDEHLKSSLVTDAFKMAITKRKPYNQTLLHSDRGVQYTSNEARNLFKRHDVISSMSRKGNCYDNAAMESFFSTLKTEALPEDGVFTDKDIAKSELFEYIECYYNRKRIHGSIGYDSPIDFERSLEESLIR